eukprot:scaffold128727_cov31-Attheya_sp.AAC.1
MFECCHQLGKDERERACNADEGQKKELTKKAHRLKSPFTGFMAHKYSCCETYNSAQEKSQSTFRRNYWDVADIPNMTIHKLFVSAFGPEKSRMLDKKKELQLDF